ncbi:hypothetical protein CPB83DRAFT_849447 [Crepidotus variabilis]|uniref:Capsular associated protein n=1 Tax=Crepidotus variabilis TaxID=179855 RepID=A0A9P6ELU3_9AGAR|nr:hypothetical protein CPB83DRAFT_849447 [Crepidotus variabilis]
MPRRSPHISFLAHRMGSDTEKPAFSLSRQRSYKIWGLVLGILLILTLSHFIFPSSPTPPTPSNTYTNKNLKPKNYFNTTGSTGAYLPNPFPFCNPALPNPLSEKYTPHILSKTPLHTGSNARLKRIIHRALSGHPTTISIIGGSISACHGSGDDPISPKCYPAKTFEWWNDLFPHPASELTNGAMRKTTSQYFGYCVSNHIPDAPDLVIVELDTSDEPGPGPLESYELLLRTLLSLPSTPAVLLLSHFSPQTHLAHGFAGAGHSHLSAAHFYDTPQLSISPILLPLWMKDSTSVLGPGGYYTDMVLSNERGHEVMSDVLRAFIEKTTCEVWDEVGEEIEEGGEVDKKGLFAGLGHRPGVPEEHAAPAAGLGAGAGQDPPSAEKDPLIEHSPRKKPSYDLSTLSIPPHLMSTPPTNNKKFEEPSPFCVSANDLVNPLPPTLFYGSGWSATHPSGTGAGSASEKGPLAHYWSSTLPTSKIRIPIQTGAGDVGIYYLAEPTGIHQIANEGGGRHGGALEPSSVECWVDDNYPGAKVVENRGEGEERAVLHLIDHNVSRGSHFIECQLLGEEGVHVREFKIVGVFAT